MVPGIALLVVLLLLAFGMAIVAVRQVLPLRHQVNQLASDVNSLQVALEDLRSELADLRAAAQAVPAPPLPKTRPGGLDDLRERLRAAHSESEESAKE
jgi:outer membrane murein-binding lipoprotein Lpp